MTFSDSQNIQENGTLFCENLHLPIKKLKKKPEHPKNLHRLGSSYIFFPNSVPRLNLAWHIN